MFDSRFNNNFQNTVANQDLNANPYQDQFFGQNNPTPYREDVSIPMPQPMTGNVSEDNLYPLESSTETPNLNISNRENFSPTSNYAEGGTVKKRGKKEKFNPYPSLAEMIREQGQGEDMILAHINPLEAMMLQQMGGSGTINPVTGLPQFGFFNKPWKALKSVLGGGGGAILGNMILPGIGGIIGGALGQGGQHAIRGKNALHGALKGATIGASLPSAASLLGSGASKLGLNSAGNYLSSYGAENAILPSLGIRGGGVAAGEGGSSLGNMITGGGGSGPTISAGTGSINGIGTLGEAAKKAAEKSWFDKMTEPKNLLAAVALGGSFLNQPKEKKEKSPEQIASEEKRYRNAARLSRAEIEADEVAESLKKQANYRLRHNLAGGESLAAAPIYRKVNTPEEYKKNNRWLEYYDKPDFLGNPILMAMGGKVPKMRFEEEEIEYPSGLGFYLKGHTGGQDDKRPMKLPEGSYIIDASTVSDLGDGNSEAGKKQLDALVSDGEYYIAPKTVSNMGKGNNNLGAKKLDEMVKNIRQHKRGGSIHLPPKAKSLASYMTR